MRLPWELPDAVGTHPNLGDEAFRRMTVDASLSDSKHLLRHVGWRDALAEYLHRELPLTTLDDNGSAEIWSLSFNDGLLHRAMAITVQYIAEPDTVGMNGLAFWYAEDARGSPLFFPNRDVFRKFRLSVACPRSMVAETLELARLDAVRFKPTDLSTEPITASGNPRWGQ